MFYCKQTTESYKDIVYHQKEAHAFDELKFKRVYCKVAQKTAVIQTQPRYMCREQCRVISVDETTKTIHESRRNIISNESKGAKIRNHQEACAARNDNNFG